MLYNNITMHIYIYTQILGSMTLYIVPNRRKAFRRSKAKQRKEKKRKRREEKRTGESRAEKRRAEQNRTECTTRLNCRT